jgi:hypothetical protein
MISHGRKNTWRISIADNHRYQWKIMQYKSSAHSYLRNEWNISQVFFPLSRNHLTLSVKMCTNFCMDVTSGVDPAKPFYVKFLCFREQNLYLFINSDTETPVHKNHSFKDIIAVRTYLNFKCFILSPL